MTDQEFARRLVAQRASPEPLTGCFLWTGALEGKGAHRGEGYAVARRPGGKKVKIIRALLGLKKGGKKLACHRCNTPACVNENHLYAGTASQNMQDKVRSGRDPNARKTHCSHGHPLDGRYRDGTGWVRYCKTCRNARQRVRRANA